MIRRWFALLTLVALGGGAWADELAEQVRAVFERARGQLLLVRFQQPVPGMSWGDGGGGDRRADITGFLADESTVVVPTASLERGGRGRGVFRGPGGMEMEGEQEEEEPYGFKAVLPGGTEIPLDLRRRDPATGFSILKLKGKAPAGALRPVTFAPVSPRLADPVVIVDISGQDLGFQPRFTISRVNVIHNPEKPVFGTTDGLEGYQGGLAFDLKGEVVGVVAPAPRGAAPRGEDQEGERGPRGMRAMFGRGAGARIVSGKWVQEALSDQGNRRPEEREAGGR